MFKLDISHKTICLAFEKGYCPEFHDNFYLKLLLPAVDIYPTQQFKSLKAAYIISFSFVEFSSFSNKFIIHLQKGSSKRDFIKFSY